MIDRNSPIPLYYQLKLHFQEQIKSGTLPPGNRLPTEMELCEQFQISRAPVRQALTEMAREGLIYRRAGQGTFVAPLVTENLKQRTTIRVLAYFDTRWIALLENALHQWNMHHPKRQAQLNIQMCNKDEYHYVLRRAVAQGNAPDIVPLDYAWLADYAYAGYITAINKLDTVWVDEYTQDLEVSVLKNNLVHGSLYGVPIQADITGLWYRKDWFAELGLMPPQTWVDWLNLVDYFAQSEVMQRFGYQHSVVMPVTAAAGEAIVNLLLPFIWANGGNVINASGELTLNSPEVYETLHFLQELTIKRRTCIPQSVGDSHRWDLVRFFAHGDVPMALGGTYELSRMRDEATWMESEEEIVAHLGFTLIPCPSATQPRVGSLGGTSWAILQQSAVQDLSMEVLKLMSSQTILTSFCKENLQISPRCSVNARITDTKHPWLSTVVPLLSKARTRPLIPNYIQISRFLRQMFEQVLWVGSSVEETVSQTTQSLSLLLER